jgi:hypothetical protein
MNKELLLKTLESLADTIQYEHGFESPAYSEVRALMAAINVTTDKTTT